MTALDAESLRFWTWIEEWGFWLVIIGVFGESIESIARFVIWLSKKHLTEKAHNFLLIPELIFWAMVVVGLAMEFQGAHKARIITEKENTRLTKQLDLTKAQASEAIEEAAKADERAGDANRLAGEANERASTNDIERLKLEKEVWQLRSENEPRVFSDQSGAAERLKEFAGTKVAVFCQSNEKEPFETAEQIKAALALAKWDVKGAENNMLATANNKIRGTIVKLSSPDPVRVPGMDEILGIGFVTGVTVHFNGWASENTQQLELKKRICAALISELDKAKIVATLGQNSTKTPGDWIILVVGSKPRGQERERLMQENKENLRYLLTK